VAVSCVRDLEGGFMVFLGDVGAGVAISSATPSRAGVAGSWGLANKPRTAVRAGVDAPAAVGALNMCRKESRCGVAG
jgi:hypothetical protein